MTILNCASKEQAGDDARHTTSGATSRTFMNIDKTLDDTSDELWVYLKGALSTTSGFAATYSHLVGAVGLDTTWPSGTVNPRCRAEYDSDKNVRLTIVDANGNTSSSADLYTTDTSNHRWLLKITWLSSTQMKAEFFEDGTSKGTLTHTAGGGIGTIRFRHAAAFLTPALGKGITNSFDWDDALVADQDTSVSGDLAGSSIDSEVAGGTLVFEMLLPDGDVGGEAEWKTSGGATGTYTEWDDAAGAYSTADYNHIDTDTTAAKTQASEFGASPTADKIYCVAGYAFTPSQPPNFETAKYDVVGDDGTEAERDAYGGATAVGVFATGPGNGVWNRQPSATTTLWTNSTLDAANFKCRKLATTLSADWRVDAFWLIIVYKPGAAAARRIFICG